MNECRHGLSEDCPGCMQETIDALAKALRELPSSTEQVEALRESEVTWIVKELGDSIANLGYPVGMGIAPHTEQLKRAAEALFERWCKMASKIACFTPAQRAPWQLIETAPKDGTEIIGVHFREWEGMSPSVYGPWTIAFKVKKWRSSWDGSEVVSYMSDFGTEYKEPDCEPTHWMPLPTGPAVTSTERGEG